MMREGRRSMEEEEAKTKKNRKMKKNEKKKIKSCFRTYR